MKIIISGRAEVYDERAHALDTNPETLRKLHGLAYTEGEMSYFIGDGSDDELIADIASRSAQDAAWAQRGRESPGLYRPFGPDYTQKVRK